MTEPGDTVAAVDWKAYEAEALAAYEAASTLDELNDVNVRFLGRRADLPQALRQVRDRETGKTLNELRTTLEEAQHGAAARIGSRGFAEALGESIDVTLPGESISLGRLHPITQIRRAVEDTFLGLGYEVATTARSRPSSTTSTSSNFARRTRAARRAHVLLRRDARPAHGDLALADPRRWKRSRRRSTWSRSAASTGATRSSRRAIRSSTSSRGSPSISGITLADLKGTLLHLMRALYGARAARPVPDALLPVHGAVDRAGRLVRHLRAAGLPHVQALGLDRDGRRRDGRPATCSRTSGSTPRRAPASPSAAASSGPLSSGTDMTDIRALWEERPATFWSSSDARPGLDWLREYVAIDMPLDGAREAASISGRGRGDLPPRHLRTRTATSSSSASAASSRPGSTRTRIGSSSVASTWGRASRARSSAAPGTSATGATVAVALPGAVLPGGTKLERGEASRRGLATG